MIIILLKKMRNAIRVTTYGMIRSKAGGAKNDTGSNRSVGCITEKDRPVMLCSMKLSTMLARTKFIMRITRPRCSL